MRITNSKSYIYTTMKKEFKANNMFAQWTNGVYVVYSYGKHFPMYIYNPIRDKWYENLDKYSKSTSKQQNQARPRDVETTLMTTVLMKCELEFGYRSAQNARRVKV